MTIQPRLAVMIATASALSALTTIGGIAFAQAAGPLPPPLPMGQTAATAPSNNNPTGNVEVEPLSRGPVHEAFAKPVGLDPRQAPTVPKKAPEPIDELPPEQIPEGENVQWVPGYWSWDDEGKDFIWISGVWRNIPPGRRWVPGYWNETDGGVQRIAGFWASADARELDYLSNPPNSLEQGPNVPPPGDDFFGFPVPGFLGTANTAGVPVIGAPRDRTGFGFRNNMYGRLKGVSSSMAIGTIAFHSGAFCSHRFGFAAIITVIDIAPDWLLIWGTSSSTCLRGPVITITTSAITTATSMSALVSIHGTSGATIAIGGTTIHCLPITTGTMGTMASTSVTAWTAGTSTL